MRFTPARLAGSFASVGLGASALFERGASPWSALMPTPLILALAAVVVMDLQHGSFQISSRFRCSSTLACCAAPDHHTCSFILGLVIGGGGTP